eukprot:1157415-Pelagomonas_calceolata.AAC.3
MARRAAGEQDTSAAAAAAAAAGVLPLPGDPGDGQIELLAAKKVSILSGGLGGMQMWVCACVEGLGARIVPFDLLAAKLCVSAGLGAREGERCWPRAVGGCDDCAVGVMIGINVRCHDGAVKVPVCHELRYLRKGNEGVRMSFLGEGAMVIEVH